MFGICAAFVALVIAVVLLTNADFFRSNNSQETQTGSLPPGQVGYDLKGFLHDETFFDAEEISLPIVEVNEGAPEEGTEGYTYVIPDGKAPDLKKAEKETSPSDVSEAADDGKELPENVNDTSDSDSGKEIGSRAGDSESTEPGGKTPNGADDRRKETGPDGKTGNRDL